MADGPPDPLTELAQGAAQAHELFLAYVEAGFSRHEALQIIIATLTAGIAANMQQGKPDG